MAGVVRELVTLWGFDIDKKPLQELDAGINVIKGSLKAIGIATAATAGAIGFLLNEAGKQEQVNVAFETMIGNAERARELVEQLQQFAARTPFTIPGIESSAKQLLGMGVEVDKILPTLKALGDVAAGLSIPISRLSLNFGQVKAQSKLTGRELRDFAIAGVPLLSELAKQMGKTKQEILSLVSAGSIGFDEVEKAFISMTSAGGRFNNLMIKQSKTLKGLISNAQDFGIIFARELGQEILPVAKEIVTSTLEWLEANRKIIKQDLSKFLKILVGLFGDMIFFIKTFTRAMTGVVAVFGGWNDALQLTFKLFTAILALGMLAGIGLITKAVFGLAVAWRTMGNAALIAQLKMAAIPIAIGAIVVAIALIAEDILAFSQGRDSVFGRMLDGLDLVFDKIKEKFGIFGELGTQIIFGILAPIRLVVNGIRAIGQFLDALKGKISFLDAAKNSLKLLGDTFGFGKQDAATAFGAATSVTQAASQVALDNTPVAGLGAAPFTSADGGGKTEKTTNIDSKIDVNLNVTGMDPLAAENMVKGTLTQELDAMFRSTVRDGESQVER